MNGIVLKKDFVSQGMMGAFGLIFCKHIFARFRRSPVAAPFSFVRGSATTIRHRYNL